MDGGEGDVAALVHLVGIRAEGDLVQKVCQGGALVHAAEFIDGVDEFVDVRLFVDAFVRVVGIHAEDARAVDDLADELVRARLGAADDELFEERPERLHLLAAARGQGEGVYVEHGVVHGELVFGGVMFQHLDGLAADAALGHVDDAGDRLAVEGVVDHAQVGQKVFDLFAFIEAEAPEHLVRDAVLGKFLLVRAGEGVEPHEHGEVRKGVALRVHQVRNGAGDVERLVRLRFRLIILCLGARVVLRPQLLVFAAAVVADDGVGELQNIFGGTVVALQLIHLRPGEVFFKPQNIFDLGAAPAVDALVVVADGEEVAVHGG